MRIASLPLVWWMASSLVTTPVVQNQHRGGGRRRSLTLARMSQTPPEYVDALIEEFLGLRPYELPGKVSQEAILRMVGQPSFFLRIAEMCDAAPTRERKEELRALADNLTNTLNAVVNRSVDRMSEATELVSSIVATAAEEDGEFLLPLSPEKLAALRNAVESAVREGTFDEVALTKINAFQKKAGEDQLDGVVALLQKVLQLYAAKVLAFDLEEVAVRARALGVTDVSGADDLHPDYQTAVQCYADLMAADAEEWDSVLARDLLPVGVAKVRKGALLAVVQAQIEQVVLLQANGSFAQRVQAEFLRELVARIEATAPGDLDDDLVGQSPPPLGLDGAFPVGGAVKPDDDGGGSSSL